MNIKQLMQDYVDGATYGRSASVYIQGQAIFSYGPHFPLAVRTSEGYLVNKSKYSVTTTKQQSYLKTALVGKRISFATTEELRSLI
jgi:hypothetical protein